MPETPKPKSFADILQQNQDFIAHLQVLQEDVGVQLEEKEKELALAKRQLAEKQQELDEMQNAQLQWAMDRQSLLDQHESLKQGHVDLQQSHDQAKVELARLKDDIARAKTRDEERRGQLRQLEQERIRLAQKSEVDQKKIRADLKAAQDDLDSLQSAQLQWAMDRETLLKDRDTAVSKQAQLEQEWQKARAELTKDKARLTDTTAQLQQQLKAAQAELEPLKAARDKWQAERQRLVADVARLEQGSQASEAQFKADRKLLQGQLDEARKKGADLDKAEAEFGRISDERSALLTKVKALEKDWQSREASIAEEKAALRKQVGDAVAKLAAMQQDYEKVKALHADLAGETGRKAEQWTAREQRLTSEKNQLKVDLERVQAQLSDMMSQSNDLQTQRASQSKELEQAWLREKASLKAQLDEARKAAGSGPPSSRVPPRYEAEKRAIRAPLDSLGTERTARGKNKDAPPALAQAKRDFEAKFRVIYDQSHDLNSPLNASNGFSEILLDEKGNKTTPEERREFVAHINERAKQLRQHIRIVLTSKVNTESLPFDIGQAAFVTKPIDRQQLLQRMVKFDLRADGKRGKKTRSSILIVDDDPQNIRLVKAMLKPFNMEVMVADGGKAGLELALKKKPDLIILDLMMPDVDGFEVVSKLREDPAGSQIPILIYTAKNITSEDRERLQGNIQTIIQKGDFGKDRFLEMINNLQTTHAA